MNVSKNKKIIIILSVVAVVLLLVNFLIVTNQFHKPTCVKDVCFYGEGSENPYSFMKNLSSNQKIILKNEDSEKKSQTASYIARAMMQLAEAYPAKNYTFISIGLDENKQPVKCYCEKTLNSTSFIDCNYSLQQCIDAKPGENEFMINLHYPDSAENKVLFKKSNLVEVQAKTGVDLYAITGLLKAMAQ